MSSKRAPVPDAPFILRPRGWEIPEREATPEHVYLNRRQFMRMLGIAGLGAGVGAAGLTVGCGHAGDGETAGGSAVKLPPPSPTTELYPATRNAAFALDRPLTDEEVAASYNNFYEFTTDKSKVWTLVDRFTTRPWTIEIAGLVDKPRTIDIDGLVRAMGIEERLYRHRCVEAWAMAVPWTGFPMRRFVEWARPLASARYVRMVTFNRPEQAPGFTSYSYYPWPYFEALSLAEATNEVTLLATGIYGHELPKQHGAPLRLVVPWKYGYKSIKSIVRFEFTEEQPATFWSTLVPKEYDFLATVNPEVPHPRWSQASERMIGTGERRPTVLYNGYGEFVADLYG